MTVRKRPIFLLYIGSLLICSACASDISDTSASYFWDIGIGVATVNSNNHARYNITCNIPVWKLDASFDLELFIDTQGKVLKKTWNFDSGKDIARSLLRKINYIRFEQPENPFAVTIGTFDALIFSNGFIVDRFTNSIQLPDKKFSGLNISLKNLFPIGLTVEGFTPDFVDFSNDGGIIGGHISLKPLATIKKAVLREIEVHGIVTADVNLFAPAREWDFSMLYGNRSDRDEDGILDGEYLEWLNVIIYNDSLSAEERERLIEAGEYDTLLVNKEQWAKDSVEKMVVIGGDIVMPFITKEKYSLTLYGQGAIALDDRDIRQSFYKGWGIGFPGIAYNVSNIFKGGIEFQHCEGTFAPHFFNKYYLAERVARNPARNKMDQISSKDLNGFYTQINLSPINFITIDCRYNFLVSEKKEDGFRDKDIRFESALSLNPELLYSLPVNIHKFELFYYQTDINKDIKYTTLFHRSPTTYWGFRLNWELFPHAFLEAYAFCGWQWKDDSHLVLLRNNTIACIASLKF